MSKETPECLPNPEQRVCHYSKPHIRCALMEIVCSGKTCCGGGVEGGGRVPSWYSREGGPLLVLTELDCAATERGGTWIGGGVGAWGQVGPPDLEVICYILKSPSCYSLSFFICVTKRLTSESSLINLDHTVSLGSMQWIQNTKLPTVAIIFFSIRISTQGRSIHNF